LPDLQDVPNLSMKHLRAIVTLARFGSFVAAASALRMSQPGLSRIIQQAEARLGVKLFTRGTRSVSQTEAGVNSSPPRNAFSASCCNNHKRRASSMATCEANSSLRA
jgi:Bacterial regulatory helix-turn-helix protein, lysR family